jgi:signal transduction histidine kinase
MIEVRDLPVAVPMPLALLASLVLTAPIALAWRRPLMVASAVWAMAVGFSAAVVPLSGRFTAIGLTVLLPFFVAAFSARRGAAVGLAVCVVGEALVFGLPSLPVDVPLVLLSWIGGVVLAERGRLVGQLRRTTAQLAAGRAAALRSAILGERARVARDLHDSTGHRLTVVALHAAAARRMWEVDRPRARAALATIERVTAEGLGELRQGFAATAAEADPISLSALVELVDRARAAGSPVELTLEGATARLPAAAFRVVQEALTNALRHAPGAPVRASVRCDAEHVAVEVVNATGPAPAPASTGHGGHGLVGMRQRVEACAGRLDWGALPDGGFAVRAELPLATVPA